MSLCMLCRHIAREELQLRSLTPLTDRGGRSVSYLGHPTTLPTRRECPEPTEQRMAWVPELVSMFWRREQISFPCQLQNTMVRLTYPSSPDNVCRISQIMKSLVPSCHLTSLWSKHYPQPTQLQLSTFYSLQ